MPASYAHTLFGEKVYHSLDKSLQHKIEPYKEYYDMGLYGPDPLFFYQPYHHHSINRQGYQIHEQDAYDFFIKARELIHCSLNPQASLAYICGFINHFILDSECHGYIGQIEKKMNATHAEIESDFDRQLLLNEGYIPEKTCLNQFIHTDKKIAEVMAPFFDRNTNEMHKVIESMSFYLWLLYCPNQFKKSILFNGMKLVGAYDSMHGMVVIKEENEKCKESTPHLIELLDQSVPIAVNIIEEYVNMVHTQLDLNQRFHHNFE